MTVVDGVIVDANGACVFERVASRPIESDGNNAVDIVSVTFDTGDRIITRRLVDGRVVTEEVVRDG